MDRRLFCLSSVSLLIGCGGGDMEYEIQPSPTRTGHLLHSDVQGSAAAFAGTLGSRFIRKTADESVTSSTTLQDDDHLTFVIRPNEEWIADIIVQCGTALDITGLKKAMSVPSWATYTSFFTFFLNT